jgi:hypothetical protein
MDEGNRCRIMIITTTARTKARRQRRGAGFDNGQTKGTKNKIVLCGQYGKTRIMRNEESLKGIRRMRKRGGNAM